MLRSVVLLAATAASAAFAPSGGMLTTPSRLPQQSCRLNVRSPLQVQMGKSLAQKKEIVTKVKARLSSAQLIFSLTLEKVTMPEINNLRNSLPAGSNAIVIKNRLLKRASSSTTWAASESLAKRSNLWIVVDEDVKGSIKAFKDWQKATKKEEGIIGGVVEGMAYDSKGIEAIGSLPSKSELYAQIAGAIQAVPAKLAGTVKEIPQKTARAIKLAVSPDA